MTVRSSQRLDAFDQWCLRHILRVPFTAHVTNQEVRLRSAQPPVTQTVMLRRLRFFGHIIRSDSDEDHARALNAGINDPPKETRSGNDLMVALVKHATHRREWPQTSESGAVVGPAMTVICGVISWKRRRFCRGMLHDDGDDDAGCTDQNGLLLNQ